MSKLVRSLRGAAFDVAVFGSLALFIFAWAQLINGGRPLQEWLAWCRARLTFTGVALSALGLGGLICTLIGARLMRDPS